MTRSARVLFRYGTLGSCYNWMISSAVEHFVDIEGVTSAPRHRRTRTWKYVTPSARSSSVIAIAASCAVRAASM